MNTVQILLLSTLIFFIIYWYISKADLLSPAKVFGVIWGVSIFLALFKFSGYQFAWSEYSWFVLLLGLLSFLVGVFIIFAINSDKKAHTVPEIRKYFLSGNCFDSFKLSAAIKVLFFSYLVALLVEILVFGTVPILSSKPDFARVKFGLYGVHLLVNIIPALLFLCVEYLVFNFKNKRGKLFITAIFLVASVSYFLLLERFNYFFAFIMCLGLLYYATDLMKFKTIFIISVIFLAIVWILQNIRLSQYAEQFIYITSKMRYSSDYAVLTGPYMYIVMNLENMAKGVSLLNNHSYGILTGDWLFALTGLKNWVQEYFNIDYRRFVYSGYNTYPFLWDYFYDFGIIGVALFPMILGSGISSIYYSLKIKPNIKWLNLYSFSLFIIIISFFTNPLSSLNVVFNLFVIWAVSVYISRDKKDLNLKPSII